jgi:serine/threonine protein kinase
MNKELPAGSPLSHYRIISKIGAGGMGEVYQAHDSRLNRDVAIKLLPADFANHEYRLHRFEQEARATSALNHPNIAHIYEIGESESTNFIAMEFIDGVSSYCFPVRLSVMVNAPGEDSPRRAFVVSISSVR